MRGRTVLGSAAVLVFLGLAAALITVEKPNGISLANAGRGSEALSDDQRNDVRDVIKSYLVENPQVIAEALEALQARRRVAERTRVEQALVARRDELIASPDDPAIGPDNASVTLVEFFDYQCPYCKRMTGPLESLIEQEKNLRIVFKEFPILGEPSVLAAHAALAADRQGKYLEFHMAMMKRRGKPSQESIEAVAKAVGLDLEQLRTDMQRKEIRDKVQANNDLARTLGVTGTPAFIIGDEIVPGAVTISRLRSLIDKARKSDG